MKKLVVNKKYDGKNDGKMCGYEGEEWVSDYDFVPGCRQLMRQTRASNI